MAETPAVSDLPRFRRPPVIEVAIGVEFLPLTALTAVPLVELRSLWKADYPHIEEQPAIRSAPRGGFDLPGLNFQIASGIPPMRIWLLSDDHGELLQVQNDRLILNWRSPFRTTYPHYAYLAPRFAKNWNLFREAVSERSLGELRPIMAEVTYVNRIGLQRGETLFDALTILAMDSPIPNAEPSVQIAVPLLEQDGATQFGQQTVSATRSAEQSEEFDLTLVTHVGISNADESSIQRALERAHAIGVTNFAKVTRGTMHERWEGTQ